MVKDKKQIVKLVLPICVALIVLGIWFVKNPDSFTKSQLADAENNGEFAGVEDFLLEASSVDLEKLKSYNLPIILDFGADSCEPCKKMAPVLVKLNSEMKGKAIIKFIDVWKNSNSANNFPVQVIPTQIFINSDGTPYVPSADLQIKFEMYSYQDTGEHAFTTHQGGLTEAQMRTILADMGVPE